MNPEKIYPRSQDRETVYLKNVVTDPCIQVGEYTMYNDFVRDPRQFEKNNVLYHYPVNHDKLVIGKFCSIACGAKFLFTSAHHTQASLSTYPFPIFFEEWGLPVEDITSAWDNKGDIRIGNDVWIGYEAVVFDHWRRRRHRRPRGCNKRCPALYHCGRRAGQDHPQALFGGGDRGAAKNAVVGLAGRKTEKSPFRSSIRPSGSVPDMMAQFRKII